MARSSTKAEFWATSTIGSKVTWIQPLLHEHKVSIFGSPFIYCDNLSATYTCPNPILHTIMKHLALAIFLLEKLNTSQLQVKHVP